MIERRTGRKSLWLVAALVSGAALLSAAGPGPELMTEHPAEQADAASQEKFVGLAPYRGYLEAHSNVDEPPRLAGGPVEMSVTQTSGGVHVALPAQRELDPDVFGTPELPRAFGGTAGINGLPPGGRNSSGGQWTTSKSMTPFGDKAVVMGNGRLEIRATDATAVDAAASEDEVTFRASWQDEAGNTYAVECCQMLATRGVEYPTFGGVVTNHILHGSSRIGSALMPTEFTYLAFWGMGRVLKNGEVQQAPRLVHGMLTEYVRGEGYELTDDAGVTPTRKHFHLMVPPMMPQPKEGRFQHSNVKTGFTLPNGKQLPFWHVMFGNLDVQGSRGG